MKKTIIIFSILFITITTSIFSIIKINTNCNSTIAIAENFKQVMYVENKKNLLHKTSNLESLWEKNSKLMRIFLKRDVLTDIDLEILSLKNNILNFNKAKINKNLEYIKKYCEEIQNDMKPIIYNIL